MRPPDSWEAQNNHYLAAAVAWVRWRLLALISTEEVDPQEGDALERTMYEAADIEPPPAILVLSERFGLSAFEQNVILLCASLELDTRLAGMCAAAQSDMQRPFPTFGLAMALFDNPAWEALSPDRPLRYWRLLEITQVGAEPLTSSALRADERIVNFIKALHHIDNRLTPFLFDVETPQAQVDLSPTQADQVEAIAGQLAMATPDGRPEVVQLVGPDSGSKIAVAGALAKQMGHFLYRLPAELLPRQTAELESLARLWQRECFLLPMALYLDAMEMEANKAEASTAIDPVRRFLARLSGLIFLDSRHVRPQLGRRSLIFDIHRPTTGEQRKAWEGFAKEPVAEQLASQFNLNLASIRRIGWTIASRNGKEESPSLTSYWEACRNRTRPRLDLLAQRLNPKAGWDDIILPGEQMGLLHEIADQVRERTRVYEDWGFRRKMNRGLGITALFAGESGTGKTMAAEVIAKDLDLDLYRIDLSAVVSKYIGETEKNLRRLFDAAEDGGAILFFDEADALFGKRSEVRDSHDRYANIEINYLLQRMEAYRGLAILATNMKSALDPAFMRRIRFIANFPFPGFAERQAIWKGIYPEETPLADLDYERLAELNLTGGSIHNIGLNAAFQAARLDEPVSMMAILAAARTEFRKLDRPFDERLFLVDEVRG